MPRYIPPLLVGGLLPPSPCEPQPETAGVLSRLRRLLLGAIREFFTSCLPMCIQFAASTDR